MYNFYRGENLDPNFIISDDNGTTWSNGGWLIRKDKERPYIKYASNNVDKIFFAVSDAHPREYYNHGHGGTNIYLGYLYSGGVNGGIKMYRCGGIILYTQPHKNIEIHPGSECVKTPCFLLSLSR